MVEKNYIFYIYFFNFQLVQHSNTTLVFIVQQEHSIVIHQKCLHLHSQFFALIFALPLVQLNIRHEVQN